MANESRKDHLRTGKDLARLSELTAPDRQMFSGRDIGRVESRRPRTLSDPTATALFLGEDSRGADLGKLATAKQMATEGADPENIWRSTGWFNQHGRWSYEIDDNPSRTLDTRDTGKKHGRSFRPMGSVLAHPELYRRVPDAARVPIQIAPDVAMGAFGEYDRDHGALGSIGLESPRELPRQFPLRSTAWHELQHFLDRKMGLATGDGDAWAASPAERRAVNAEFRNRLGADERSRRSPLATEDEMLRIRQKLQAEGW